MLNELHKLLERERQALLMGDFGKIEEFASEKEALVADLEQFPDELTLELCKRNTRLIQAARNGLRAAIDQVHVHRKTGRNLGTYNALGQREVGAQGTELGRF